MEIFLLWLGLSILVGVFAQVRRNRSGLGWGILAVVISPLLAGILVAILKPYEGPRPGGEAPRIKGDATSMALLVPGVALLIILIYGLVVLFS